VERGDGEPGVLDRDVGGVGSQGVQRVDDRVEHPRSVVPPAGGVQRHGQLAVAPAVEGRQGVDQLTEIGATVEPGTQHLRHPRPDRPAAVAQQSFQEAVTGTEVVIDPRIGHADAGGVSKAGLLTLTTQGKEPP